MARQALFQSSKSIAGVALLSIGLIVLLANLDAATASLTDAIGSRALDGAETLLTFGLAGMHALQTYAFEPSRFVSELRHILVSFWPLILVVLGALLLRGAFGSRPSGYSTNAGTQANGERL